MKTEAAILQALAEPFAGDVVKWRAQGKAKQDRDGVWTARVVAYVDARIVIDRLNSVMGLGWQKRTTETAKGRVLCSIGLTLPSGREVWRDDGAGDTDIEGEKGAISDALKRAAVNFGVAAYLYELPSPYVAVDGYMGKSRDGKDEFKITGLTKASKERLSRFAQRSLDEWKADLAAVSVEESETPAPRQPQQEPQTEEAVSPPPPPPPQERKSDPAKAAPKSAAKPAPAKVAEKSATTKPAAKPAQDYNATPRANVLELPKVRTPEAWREWSRSISANIRACTARTEAQDFVNANAEGLSEMSAALETDAMEWANDRVHAVFLQRSNKSNEKGSR